MAMDFFLAGDGATRRGEGCSGLEIPLSRIKLERTREQKKTFRKARVLASTFQSHSERLTQLLCKVARATQA